MLASTKAKSSRARLTFIRIFEVLRKVGNQSGYDAMGVRRKRAGVVDGDRQMVNIPTAVLSDDLLAVEAACLEALRESAHSNIELPRRREPEPPITISRSEAVRPRHAPVVDCTRYDSLRMIR